VAGIFVISFIVPILLFLPIRTNQYEEYYRMLSPIYPFLVLIVFSGLDDLSNLLRNLLKRGWLRHIIVAAVCAMGMVYPSTHVIRIFLFNYRDLVEEGAYKIRWNESPSIKWLNINRPEGKMYSNLPFFVYFYTGRTACTSPTKSRYLWPLKECSVPKGTYYSECCLPINGKSYLIWWNHASYRLIYDPKELAALFEVKEIAVFPEGAIYLLTTKGVSNNRAVLPQ
jgi:hypothetical protein